ncbi:MAG: hypothetical protein GZ085_00335 [Sulfuriferula multivorans]|uniref:Uncharacterized protein n=1 Tax=Sulfuriferula multivorans TaxID=1559896 RepID=A0A7C9JZN1_9PROT|nr:hypothetical protein [Sulfuriferula multivorans]
MAIEAGDPQLCLGTPHQGEKRHDMSKTLQILLAQFPGAVQIPLANAAAACSIRLQTARNQLVAGTFPIRTVKIGRRRLVRLDDLAAFIDGLFAPQKIKLGPSLKSERLQAKARGVTVKQLRARAQQEGSAQ